MKKIKRFNKPILLILSVMTLIFLMGGASFDLSAQKPLENGSRDMLVTFEPNAPAHLIETYGGTVKKTFMNFPTTQADIPESAIFALYNSPFVRSIEENQIVFSLSDSVPWGVDRVFDDETFPFDTFDLTTGTGVGVAVIDTGIDRFHPDLNVAGGTNTIDDTDWGSDPNSHGTHVAGTIAALKNDLGVVGVAPDAALYAIKALDNEDGTGTTSSLIDGIDWAVSQGIPIINMSLGTPSQSSALENALDTAYGAGHLLIAAAGNDGDNGAEILYPAAYESVIAVSASATHPSGQDRLANFSSYGDAIELIAPGSNIVSTLPNSSYGSKSGTSMAAPHVSGVAALIWSAMPGLTNEQVRDILRNSAEDVGLSADKQGYGMVRADLSVQLALDTTDYFINATSNEGGSISPSGIVNVDAGESVSFDFIPDTGYAVEHVLVDGTDIGAPSTYTFTDVHANHTIEVFFAQTEYTIVFNTHGGSAVSPITAFFGDTIDPPDQPSLEGHSFKGWYESEAYDALFVFDTMPAEDLTLHAKWEVNLYTITFETGDGDDVAPLTEYYGETITAPEEPEKYGHAFEGWYVDQAFTEPYVFSSMPAASFTLYAKWTLVGQVITFDAMGGSDVGPIIEEPGTAIDPPDAPLLEGHSFLGWYTDTSFNDPFVFDTMPAEDRTLYAKWQINDYILSFDTGTGHTIDPLTRTFGAPISAPSTPVKTGHTFTGWYTDSSPDEPFIFDTMPATDLTLYAGWTVNTYTITFESGEGSQVYPRVFDFGATIVMPDAPEKRGHTFTGWYTDAAFSEPFVSNTMPAGDRTLYAKWEINTYTVHFNTRGGSYVAPMQITFDAPIPEPDAPTRPAHRFEYWMKDDEPFDFENSRMPDRDLIITAFYLQVVPPEIEGFEDRGVYATGETRLIQFEEGTITINDEPIETGDTVSAPGLYEVHIINEDGIEFHWSFIIAEPKNPWGEFASFITLSSLGLFILIKRFTG